jgi:hypothetical protein
VIEVLADHCTALALAASVARAAVLHPAPKIVEGAFFSKQAGWIGSGSNGSTNKSATALFYENGGGSYRDPFAREW